MTWKNDSNAYEIKATYGSVEDQIKESAQKYTAKHFAAAKEQTKAFIDKLEPGTYRFQYLVTLPEIVAESPNLKFTAYDRLSQIATVVKE